MFDRLGPIFGKTSHGCQSELERTIWIGGNTPRMVSPAERDAAIVEFYPTIVAHMRLDVPVRVAVQFEGQSLLFKEGAEGGKSV